MPRHVLRSGLVFGIGAVCVVAHAEPGAPATEVEALLHAEVAHPGGLTADEAAERAGTVSTDLVEQRALDRAAEHAVADAASGFLPTVSASARFARLSPIDPPPFGPVVAAPGSALGVVPAGATLRSLYITSYPFGVPLNNATFAAGVVLNASDWILRVLPAYEAARHLERGAAANVAAAKANVRRSARILYYAWVSASLRAIVAEDELRQAREHGRETERRLAAGVATEADAAMVRAQLAQAQVNILHQRSQVETSLQNLCTALHVGREGIVIGEDVFRDPPSVADSDPAPLERRVDEAFRRRPESRALEETRKAYASNVREERGSRLPRVSAFADVLTANPNGRYVPLSQTFDTTWDVGVQLGWSPNDVVSHGERAGSAEAREDAARARRERFREILRNDIVRTTATYRDAREASAAAALQAEAALAAARLRRGLYGGGGATSTELTDAEVARTLALAQLADARVALRVARAELLYVLGRDR